MSMAFLSWPIRLAYGQHPYRMHIDDRHGEMTSCQETFVARCTLRQFSQLLAY